MIAITAVRKEIKFTVQQPKPITFTVGGKPVSFTIANRNVTYVTTNGFYYTYSWTLSQIDIDNKFIIISDLSTVQNKEKILALIENAGIVLEYGIDYNIIEGSKITWNDYELESKLQVGDKIKVYY
jgi:hypothetical protein